METFTNILDILLKISLVALAIVYLRYSYYKLQKKKLEKELKALEENQKL